MLLKSTSGLSYVTMESSVEAWTDEWLDPRSADWSRVSPSITIFFSFTRGVNFFISGVDFFFWIHVKHYPLYIQCQSPWLTNFSKLPKTIENHIIKMGWDIMNGLEFFLQCNNKNQLTCFWCTAISVCKRCAQ